MTTENETTSKETTMTTNSTTTPSAKDQTTAKETPAAVALFQKAHGRMLMLQRLDEQITAMINQRKQIQDELRSLKGQINDEFERVMQMSQEGPIKLFNAVGEQGRMAEAA